MVGRWGTVTPDVTGSAGSRGSVGSAGSTSCVLEMHVDSLDWPLMVLASLDADFAVLEPVELRELVSAAAARFGRAAAGAARL